MARVFSGIQPTGRKHLGNYIGAIINYVEGQDRGDPAIYCIVDYHSLTSTHYADLLRTRTREMAAGLLALGLDPDRCTLFVQSHRPEHAELMWLLAELLKEISGFPAISLQPAAGAHGELTGMLMTRAYHRANGEGEQRRQHRHRRERRTQPDPEVHPRAAR